MGSLGGNITNDVRGAERYYMIDLMVYSTKAGELPRLVENGIPKCFVPYEQALELMRLLREAEEQIAKLNGP